ncbi:hypothetical protein HPT25_19365 [Bacillus sp. BRMEA1]|nr:hypothetical protein [Neobacillus endophyticus]
MFFLPTNVNIEQIKIGSPDHKSNLSFGSNFHIKRNVSGKKNQGFGQQMADFCTTIIPITTVYDDEIIDSPSIKINRKI